jgi:dTDP-4-dehydrorhamnose 3,5-epimerase
MSFTPLKIKGSWLYTPKRFDDERGSFHEVFKLSTISEVIGRSFEVKQVNQSLSKAGVIRGIHWADVPPGQAKYISCPRGALWDVVVDIRLGSPTIGQWDAVELSEANGQSILIEEGLGHAFLSLSDDTVANYLCTEPFNPNAEHGINPLDKTLSIPFHTIWSGGEFKISTKDLEAPSLLEAQNKSLLPNFWQPEEI